LLTRSSSFSALLIYLLIPTKNLLSQKNPKGLHL
jgi:hypothetical protein